MTLGELIKSGEKIRVAVRWGKNGRKYIIYPYIATKKQLNYEVEQIEGDVAWLYQY